MGKNTKRKGRPINVREAAELLERARRREAAQLGLERKQHRVDLANLDTPDVSHADQWADFLNRPGTFYVADIVIPLDEHGEMGATLSATTTVKADDDQLPYLVEVLRQVRGVLGQRCRITLTPAEPNTGEPPAHANAHANAQPLPLSVAEAERALVAARRAEAAAAARQRPTIPDGPPMVPGTPGGPWMPATIGREYVDREYSRDELAAMLPGKTRAEVAHELGKAPEDVDGGTYSADVMPEVLAAQLGVPVESLRRIPMTGGGYAWTVTPSSPEPTGRHAAADEQGSRGIEPTQ